MCDVATLKVLEKVVDDKLNSGALFTAFEVSLAVQRDLKNSGNFDYSQHRHQYLKNDIHQIIESRLNSGSNYARSLQDVGAGSPAFVYYPVGSDPSAYVPLNRTDRTTVSVVPPPSAAPGLPAPPTVVDSDDDDGDCVDFDRKPDQRGTLCVPATLLRACGFQNHDTAYAYSDSTNQRIVVSRTANPLSVVPPAVYTVDLYCNVRITKSVLESAGFSDSATYDFELDGNSVIVTQH